MPARARNCIGSLIAVAVIGACSTTPSGGGSSATGGAIMSSAGGSSGPRGGGGTTSAGGTTATGGVGGMDLPSGGASGGVSGGGGQSPPAGGSGGAVPTDTRTPDDLARDAIDAPVTACLAPALLCEDFESYAPGSNLAPTWTTDLTGGTLAVDATKPFAGTKGLHIKADANASSLLQIVKQGAPLFPVAKNAFYGRMMIWLTQMPTGAVHFNTVQANGLMPGTGQIAKYAYGAMYARFMAGYTVRPSETALPTIDCGKSGTTGYPEKSWACAEWQFDGPSNEMHYWIEGKAQTSVDVVKVGGGCTGTQPAGGVWQSPTFNKLMLGWYAQPFPTPIEVWIDDIVIGTERVGCPKR